MTAYVVFRLLVALALGAVWYIADRRFGGRWYRWWYDMTHEHPMKTDSLQGFVHGRPTKVRAFWAVLLSTFITLLTYLDGEFRPLQELGFWAITVPAAFLGLLAGPYINGLWQKRDTAFDAMDKWERGEIDISGELKQKGSEIGEKLRETIATTAKSVGIASGDKKPEERPPIEKEITPEQTAPPSNPEELVNKYLRRSQDSDDK
jgi:hypothetical protein